MGQAIDRAVATLFVVEVLDLVRHYDRNHHDDHDGGSMG